MTIDPKTIEKINKLHKEEYPIAGIAEKVHVSMNTVKKYLGKFKKETPQDTTQSLEVEQ